MDNTDPYKLYAEHIINRKLLNSEWNEENRNIIKRYFYSKLYGETNTTLSLTPKLITKLNQEN